MDSVKSVGSVRYSHWRKLFEDTMFEDYYAQSLKSFKPPTSIPFECPSCGQSFSNRSFLPHVRYHHHDELCQLAKEKNLELPAKMPKKYKKKKDREAADRGEDRHAFPRPSTSSSSRAIKTPPVVVYPVEPFGSIDTQIVQHNVQYVFSTSGMDDPVFPQESYNTPLQQFYIREDQLQYFSQYIAQQAQEYPQYDQQPFDYQQQPIEQENELNSSGQLQDSPEQVDNASA